ncbi:hypothetical protein MAP00_006012 [Monascus purpureus]|nr:hypothetical protein MAP00_006012 [Monascus purpureus]
MTGYIRDEKVNDGESHGGCKEFEVPGIVIQRQSSSGLVIAVREEGQQNKEDGHRRTFHPQ